MKFNNLKGQCVGSGFMRNRLACFIMNAIAIMKVSGQSSRTFSIAIYSYTQAVARFFGLNIKINRVKHLICDREQYGERAWQSIITHAANTP